MSHEYPWNGVIIEGGYPNAGSPDASQNAFGFLAAHDIDRVRVYLDPRVVMPVGTTTIPGGVQTQLLAIAAAARATVPGQATLTSQIEWAMLGTTEPTSATASRRPWVSWLENFWEKVDDLLGSHAATWGYSLLSSPTVQELAVANNDPDASMAAYSTVSWSITEHPYTHTAPWLELAMEEVVSHLRSAGCTKEIVVPVVYYPVGPSLVLESHPNGPWINDSQVWYESVLTPLGTDGFQARQSYATYNTRAAAVREDYRPSWLESAYFTQQAGATAVLDALDLTPPEWIDIPDEVQDSVSLPVTDLVATPLNRGALLEWTEPADFGDGDFTYYRIDFGGYEWRTVDTTIEVGPVDNGTLYTAVITVYTTLGASETAEADVTPLSTEPGPSNPFPPPFVEDDGQKPPITAPQPLLNAFPQARNFRPANWLKTPEEVEEGY